MTHGISQMPRPQVLSIPERLDADPDRAGRGVVMAFVDAGFFPHPDLLRPEKRILAYVDAGRPEPVGEEFLIARPAAWHGTMTACAAAGNGYLSGGRYRGLASEAKVVLVKCTDDKGELHARHVANAIRFPLRHPELRIRVMNVSVGVWDEDPEIAEVHAAVREVVAAGVVVLAAVGNQPGVAPEAPANCAEAISVGGWNDGNTRDPGDDRWFPSSHGGGKPDLVATAIWLPAPMLPGTLEAREAAGLFQVVPVLEELMERDGFSARRRPPPEHERRTLEATLSAITERIRVRKFISPDYQHVEGTSFAAPITASVVAQMLEADPRLGPALVREGLLATAKRIEGVPKEIQGAGLLQPLAAVQWVDERKARAPTAPRS